MEWETALALPSAPTPRRATQPSAHEVDPLRHLVHGSVSLCLRLRGDPWTLHPAFRSAQSSCQASAYSSRDPMEGQSSETSPLALLKRQPNVNAAQQMTIAVTRQQPRVTQYGLQRVAVLFSNDISTVIDFVMADPTV